MTARRMIAAAVIAAAGAGTAIADVTFQTILRSDQAPPQIDPLEGATIAEMHPYGVGEEGHVNLGLDLEGPNIDFLDHAAYVGLPGALQKYYREGDPFTPLSDVFFGGRLGPSVPNRSGQVAAQVGLFGDFVSPWDDTAIFVWDGSEHTLVMREDDLAPGFDPFLVLPIPGLTGDEWPVWTDDGRFVKGKLSFADLLCDCSFCGCRPDVLYAGTPASPTLVVQPFGPVPGLPGEFWFRVLNTRCTSAGTCIFTARLQSDVPGDLNAGETTLWAGDPESPTLLLRESEPVPGLDAGNVPVLNHFLGSAGRGEADINDAGEAIFLLDLAEGFGDTTADNNTLAIFGTAGNFSVVAREGDEVPGLPGVVYDDMYQNFNRVDCGDDRIGLIVTLRGAGVTSSNDEAILIGQPGAMQVVFRNGDQASGYPVGYTLHLISSPGFPSSVAFGSDAGYAMRADVRSDQGALVGRGLFAADPVTGEPVLVASTGSMIEVAPGDVRTVGGLTALSDPTGGGFVDRAPLNGQNQLFFTARFTDGTQAALLATITSGNDCAADLDGSGGVDVFDLLAYLDLWFESDAAAEFTGDDPASVDVFDLLTYLDFWFAGCN